MKVNRMKTITLSIVVAVGTMMAPLTAAPAQAGTCAFGVCEGGDITHVNDAGYDEPIIVFCDFGDPWSERKRVPEGTNSIAKCGYETDQVYVRAGEEIWCAYNFGPTYEDEWLLTFDATGRHKINDLWSKRCVLHVD